MSYFKPEEFRCKCGCGGMSVSNTLLAMLEKAREIADIPFTIVSGYRCEKHNKKVGGVDSSAHSAGLAVDIKADTSISRYKILKSLMAVGFTRLGVYSRWIHADIDGEKPGNVIWVGKDLT